jgi:hypothetical protein
MYKQPYTIDEFARTTVALAGYLAELSKQFVESGEFYSPVSFFKFILEVTGRL